MTLIALSGLLLLPMAAASRGLTEKPSPGAWPDKTLHWYYNPVQRPTWLDADAALALVQAAVAKWSACGVDSDYRGETSRRPGKMDGINVVGWARGTARQPRALTLGKARQGRLIERDIAFNSGHDEFDRKPPLLLEKVMVHEFGHALGLTHSASCGDVMTLAADCPGVPDDQLPQVPTAHDLERCRAIYDDALR